jgi:short subunit fatty acids transporter
MESGPIFVMIVLVLVLIIIFLKPFKGCLLETDEQIVKRRESNKKAQEEVRLTSGWMNAVKVLIVLGIWIGVMILVVGFRALF